MRAQILNTCQLLEDQDIDATLDRLLFLMKQSRKMMLSSGYQYWTPSLAFAIAAGDKLHDMYSTLAGRRRSTETVSKRESLEVDDSTDPLHLQFKVPTALKTRFLTSYRTSRTQAYVNKFTSLISNFGRSVRLVSKNTWINRLRNTMKDARPSAEYRSAHLLEYLLAELGHRWVYCRQLSVAVQLYSFGVVAHSNFGSYRVELIVKLFDRIVDLHNFQFVLMHLTSVEYAALLARIGRRLGSSNTVLSCAHCLSSVSDRNRDSSLLQPVQCVRRGAAGPRSLGGAPGTVQHQHLDHHLLLRLMLCATVDAEAQHFQRKDAFCTYFRVR